MTWHLERRWSGGNKAMTRLARNSRLAAERACRAAEANVIDETRYMCDKRLFSLGLALAVSARQKLARYRHGKACAAVSRTDYCVSQDETGDERDGEDRTCVDGVARHSGLCTPPRNLFENPNCVYTVYTSPLQLYDLHVDGALSSVIGHAMRLAWAPP